MADSSPRIIERKCGGYLAVSEEGSRFQIGVEGRTRDEALSRYRESLRRWERMFEDKTLDQPEQEQQ